jgi:undecaprenyl-diphosphatase
MERVHRIHDWFHRIGGITLTFGYYVPGVRHLTAYVAGATELEAWTFALFAYAGAALWSASFITLGYVLGDQWQRVSEMADETGLIVGAAAVVLLGVGYFVWRRRRRG